VLLVQLTDLHLTARVGARRGASDVWQNLDQVLAHVRQEPVDLVVLTGDLASQRRLATYRQLRERLRPFLDRVRVLPGNHDSRRLLRGVFGDLLLPGRRTANFDVEVGGWRLLGLDSVLRPFVKGRFGGEQLCWLAQVLRATARPVLVFQHHPPIAVGCWWLDKDVPSDRRRFAAVLGHGDVRAVACGHVHQEAEGTVGGVRVWTTPAVAYQFRPHARRPAAVASIRPAYRHIELDGDRIATRVVRLES